MIYTIKNEYLSLSFNSLGGSMTSIKRLDTNEELQYQKDPRSWQGQDVVIFPFVARLKGGVYTVDGKEYSMKNHGLCRYNEFTLIEDKGNEATIRFESSEDTLKQYPYNFVFDVTYTLDGKSLTVSYKVKNTNDKVMPFGIGGHPALKANAKDTLEETKIDGSKIIFDQPIELIEMVLDSSGSWVIGENSLGVSQTITLSKNLFKTFPTLILKADNIKHCILEKCNGEQVNYDFDCDYLAFWSHPQFGDYVCVEPWMSLPDYEDAPSEMMEKKSLVHLEAGKDFIFTYKITF